MDGSGGSIVLAERWGGTQVSRGGAAGNADGYPSFEGVCSSRRRCDRPVERGMSKTEATQHRVLLPTTPLEPHLFPANHEAAARAPGARRRFCSDQMVSSLTAAHPRPPPALQRHAQQVSYSNKGHYTSPVGQASLASRDSQF